MAAYESIAGRAAMRKNTAQLYDTCLLGLTLLTSEMVWHGNSYTSATLGMVDLFYCFV